jgi:hypothetical protein
MGVVNAMELLDKSSTLRGDSRPPKDQAVEGEKRLQWDMERGGAGGGHGPIFIMWTARSFYSTPPLGLFSESCIA